MTAEKAGVQAQVIGYRGSAPLLTDLIGGQVPVAFDTLDTLLPQFDPDLNIIPVDQGSDTGRCARQDDVTGQQCHDSTDP